MYSNLGKSRFKQSLCEIIINKCQFMGCLKTKESSSKELPTECNTLMMMVVFYIYYNFLTLKPIN